MAFDGECGRFYEKEFPEPGDLVVVKVTRLENNLGAYVSLLEYGNTEALILPSELSKRRFRSIAKLVRVGHQEVVTVIRVDREKGYVDLSKKRVVPEEIGITEEKFSKSKKVFLTVRQVASRLDMAVDDVNRLAIWPLYKKYGHAYDGLKDNIEDPERLFAGIDAPQEVKEAIVADMRPRLAPTAIKLRARVNVSCTGQEGVQAVRDCLLAAQKLYEKSPKFELNVQIIAPPLYGMIVECFDKAEGLKRLTEAIDLAKETLMKNPGSTFTQQGSIITYGDMDETSALNAEDEDGSDSEEETDSDEDSEDENEEEEGEGEGEEEEGEEEEESEDDDKEVKAQRYAKETDRRGRKSARGSK